MPARTDVLICEPLRTPVGRMGGVLAPLSAAELATALLRELVRRTGLGEGDVDDVVLGNGYANGESPAIGRVAALDAGLGTRVPGLQIDRRCGSGLQAVLYAATQIATGAAGLGLDAITPARTAAFNAPTNHKPNRERCPKTHVHDVPRHRSVLRGFEPLTYSMRTRLSGRLSRQAVLAAQGNRWSQRWA